MNILVNYIDTNRVELDTSYYISRIAFAKHLAIAGQGYSPNPQKLFRTLGMFLHYSYYMQRDALNNNRFSEPPSALSDPTEKGQFSNVAGKAIGDFLSKRIHNSLFTVNYEAAMRLRRYSLRGPRPDLIAFSQNYMFSLEAKGREKNSSGNMTTHKTQARSGPINVNFSVACISYNLFNRVKCNYHDPLNENTPYDNVTLSALTRNYYAGLSEFLNNEVFEYRESQYQNESFYEIELSYRSLDKIFREESPIRRFWHFELFEYIRPKLILPRNILEYAETGITNETRPFNFEIKDETNLYIDNDRVGLKIMEY